MMRICASLSSADDLSSEDIGKADVIEIRTDIFDKVPKNVLKKGQKGLLSFKGDIDPSIIPDGTWTVDVGDSSYPNIINEKISSYHDFAGTPDTDTIKDMLGQMNGDMIKGAFAVNSVNDLATIFDVSASIGKRHILLGMGELGRITRIRQKLLGNEFTFAFVKTETAPGQFSVADMKEMDDDTIITGIIGSGIGYTRSPAMHTAAFNSSSISGRYLVFDTPSLDRIEDVMVNYRIKGVNVTKPYKTDIIDHIDSVDKMSSASGAVNTVVNDNGKLKGYNTDIYGIEKALEKNSVEIKGKKALILGSGGAARACSFFLSANDCNVTIAGRNKDAMRSIAKDIDVSIIEYNSIVLKGYDILINCTPIGRDGGSYPIDMNKIEKQQAVFDMVYGDTLLRNIARKKGCAFVPGEDMLAYQGIRSFELFTSKTVPFETMRSVI